MLECRCIELTNALDNFVNQDLKYLPLSRLLSNAIQYNKNFSKMNYYRVIITVR